jgi:hypothetical protein
MTDKLIERTLDEEFVTLTEVERDPVAAWMTIVDNTVRIEQLEKKLKVLEKVELYLKTNTPEESGYYFIAGALGEVDQNLLPKELLICPAFGVDWMQIYTRTERTTGPEW